MNEGLQVEEKKMLQSQKDFQYLVKVIQNQIAYLLHPRINQRSLGGHHYAQTQSRFRF